MLNKVGKVKKLAAAVCLVAAVSPLKTSASGIPTVDVVSIVQQVIIAFEEIMQTIQQIEEFATQIEQFEAQLKNMELPDSYVWSDAQNAINGLLSLSELTSYYSNEVGSLDRYLDRLNSIEHFRNIPCFSDGGCTQDEWDEAFNNRDLDMGMEARRAANAGLIKTLRAESGQLQTDAANIRRLQSSAMSVEGEVEALQAANQFAGNMAQQMLNIRALLKVQGEAAQAFRADQLQREALSKAASDSLTSGRLKRESQPDRWSLKIDRSAVAAP